MKKMFALRAINALAGWLAGLYGFFFALRAIDSELDSCIANSIVNSIDF